MELICITGSAPGPVVATLSHLARIHNIEMVISRHPSGGWQVASGPRCRSVAAAILLEAAETIETEAPVEHDPQALAA